MIFKYAYWFFPKVIPKSMCNFIINEGLNLPKQKGLVGGYEGENKNSNLRDSDVVFLRDSWVRHICEPYIHLANKNAGWNLQLSGTEDPQFTIYGRNQFYDWHVDSYEEPDKSNTIRKLSMSLILSDKENYSGGQFMFDINKRKVECKEVREQGSIVVFPSYTYHMVKPVTRGTRYSLVLWMRGNPFV